MATKVELKDVRQRISQVVDIVGEAVGVTMGPGGQSALLETKAGLPIVTKDGVTVANAIDFEDPEMNIVARIIKQAADKTNKEAGDGTTTATVLAKEIYSQGAQLVAAGYSSTVLKKEMDIGKVKILASLDQLAVKIEEDEKKLSTLKHIAKISLNGDDAMADMISEAVAKTGARGLVKVVDNQLAKDEMISVKGLNFPAGWMSPFFADNNTTKINLESCAILITSHKLTTIQQLSDLESSLTYFMQKNIPVLFIASEVSGPFLMNLIANQKKGALKNAAIRPPYFGNVRKEFFRDLAAITGGAVIEAEENMELKNVVASQFGYAKRIEITNLDTTIIEGAGKPEQIAVRVNAIEEVAKTTDRDQDLDKVHERLAKITGSVMLIKVAQESQVEVEERKHRIEDALNATRAALECGYVPGGGASLYYATSNLDLNIPGERLLIKALEYPSKRICLNAGLGEKVLAGLDKKDLNKTIDARIGTIVEAYSSGIIDPVKVTKAAVSNAISVAGTLLTTNVIISKVPELHNPMPYQMY